MTLTDDSHTLNPAPPRPPTRKTSGYTYRPPRPPTGKAPGPTYRQPRPPTGKAPGSTYRQPRPPTRMGPGSTSQLLTSQAPTDKPDSLNPRPSSLHGKLIQIQIPLLTGARTDTVTGQMTFMR